MRAFLAAVQFLTPLPLPTSWQPTADDLRRSPPWFPLVGLIIGFLAALLAVDAYWLLPPLLASGIVTIALSAASGFLHLDGLADSADGLLACSSRDRALEIMRDSRIGAMAAMAICAVLGLKTAAFFSLSGDWFWRVAFFLPIAGRCAMLAAMAVLPYARSSGAAAVFDLGPSPGRVAWAALFALAAGWLSAGWCGLTAAASA
ncbi:MAG: adenosylcobinamide-GDP ribazoletransferase, partial [Planctomycetota bacterium]|nr:adenosylcobinamide-GDP ribazoletransferase [Planctomycetota bacterium]